MDFYTFNPSGPCRSVQLVAQAVGQTLNKIELDLFAGEHMKNADFLALNPQHIVPTLKDGDFALWESRAICTYLASKYGKDDSLYPKCPKARAGVDKLLYFDMGTLYQRFGDWFYPVMRGQQQTADPAKLEKLHEALGWLEGYLNGHAFAASETKTVADYCLVASVTSFEETGVDLSKYKNIGVWLGKCKSEMVGYEEANGKGAKAFGVMAKSKLGTA